MILQIQRSIAKRRLQKRGVVLSCLRKKLNNCGLVSQTVATTITKMSVKKTARYYLYSSILFGANQKRLEKLERSYSNFIYSDKNDTFTIHYSDLIQRHLVWANKCLILVSHNH